MHGFACGRVYAGHPFVLFFVLFFFFGSLKARELRSLAVLLLLFLFFFVPSLLVALLLKIVALQATPFAYMQARTGSKCATIWKLVVVMEGNSRHSSTGEQATGCCCRNRSRTTQAGRVSHPS